MIHYGGWISALSPFLIVAFNTGGHSATPHAYHCMPLLLASPLCATLMLCGPRGCALAPRAKKGQKKEGRGERALWHRCAGGLSSQGLERRLQSPPALLPSTFLQALTPQPLPRAEWSTAAFVALLSLGEAIWSPRWVRNWAGIAWWLLRGPGRAGADRAAQCSRPLPRPHPPGLLFCFAAVHPWLPGALPTPPHPNHFSAAPPVALHPSTHHRRPLAVWRPPSPPPCSMTTA